MLTPISNADVYRHFGERNVRQVKPDLPDLVGVSTPGLLAQISSWLQRKPDPVLDLDRAKRAFLKELRSRYSKVWLYGDADYLDEPIVGVVESQRAGCWLIDADDAVDALYKAYLHIGNWSIVCADAIVFEERARLPELFYRIDPGIQICRSAGIELLIDSFHDDTDWHMYVKANG